MERRPVSHYCNGDIECIDAIKAALTPSEFAGFCKGNVIKYVWREQHKGGAVDLIKALDYLNWARETIECMEVKAWPKSRDSVSES